MDQQERARRASAARHATGDLAARGISAVAVTWVDTSGVTRVKAVPLARLEHAAAWGIGMSPVFDAFLLDDSIVNGRYAGGPVGDLRLHPDLERIAVLTASPGWAWAPADRYDQGGGPPPPPRRGPGRRPTGTPRGRSRIRSTRAAWPLARWRGCPPRACRSRRPSRS